MGRAFDVFEPLTEQQLALVAQLQAAVAPTVEATLAWRLEYRPHAITWAAVEAEALLAKTFFSPYPDREERPVFVMRVRNNSHPRDAEEQRLQIAFLVYNLEKASRMADAARVGKMTWLIDFVGSSIHSHPSMRTSIETMALLQNHYPERLGCVVCYRAPSYFSLFWRCASPFLDPVTRRKVAFVGEVPGANENTGISGSNGSQQSAAHGSSAASTAAGAALSQRQPQAGGFWQLWGSGGGGSSGSSEGSAATAASPTAAEAAQQQQERRRSSSGGDEITKRDLDHQITAARDLDRSLLEAHFDLDTIEREMGGRHQGPLFDLAVYKAHMMASDREVAETIAAAAAAAALRESPYTASTPVDVDVGGAAGGALVAAAAEGPAAAPLLARGSSSSSSSAGSAGTAVHAVGEDAGVAGAAGTAAAGCK